GARAGCQGCASARYRIACALSLLKEGLHELARDRAGKWPQNCFAPGRYTRKHASADVVAALLGVLRESFLRDFHDPANGRRLSGRSLRVSASGVESKHGEATLFLTTSRCGLR